MEYSFASRVQALKPSVIREILKLSSDPSVIPFSAGNPAPEAFPAAEIAAISADLLATRAQEALQYSITEGHTPLRDLLKAYMRTHHDSYKDFDELIITTGAQQVVDLTARVLCEEGDTVICEAPSFIGSLNAFRAHGLRLRGVPLEEDGISLEGLEAALQVEKRARFIYLIPTFQNPSGVTMSLKKRRAVYALAKRYGIPILEDNPYSDLRIGGEPLPTIKSMDTDGLVIYAGTFSKVISPGMRVGYAIAPAAIMQKMVVCKQVTDVHTSIWAQLVIDRFMRGDYAGHLERLRGIYRDKFALITNALREHLPVSFTFNEPEGGLFIWCTLPDGIDMPAFCKDLVTEYRVAAVPGNAFLTDESEPCQAIRINYSTPTNDQIIRGVDLMGQAARKALGMK